MTATSTNGHTLAIDDALEAAADYARRGLVPLPLRDGKNPDFKEWGKFEFSEQAFRQKFYNASGVGVGVLMGPRSGIIDIEHDSPAQRDKAAEILGGVPPVGPQYATKNGEHWWFRWDDRLTACGKSVVSFSCSDGTELKVKIGTGPNPSTQSAVPPSRDKFWKTGLSLDDCDPPPLPEATIATLIRQANPRPEHAENFAENTGDIDEHLLATMRRIKAKPGEQDSSKRLFALACRCVEQDASDATAVATIRAYDSEQPLAADWSDADILRRLRDAERKVERGSAGKVTFRNTTDIGNAERFAEQHGADVRFSHVWNKWLAWDGRRWATDTSGEIPRRAKRTARSIWAEALRAPKKEMRERLGQWASASEKRDRLNAMIALAQSEQPIPVAVEQLDADPYLFNCINGTIDLRTGELQKHRREDFLTKLCPLKYPTQPGIDPDLWLDFLDRIFASNAKLIRFVQQLAGMAMLGEVQEHVLPIFYGNGANGKSVWLETICGVFGDDYAMNAPPGLLIASKGERHPNRTSRLARQAICSCRRE